MPFRGNAFIVGKIIFIGGFTWLMFLSVHLLSILLPSL